MRSSVTINTPALMHATRRNNDQQLLCWQVIRFFVIPNLIPSIFTSWRCIMIVFCSRLLITDNLFQLFPYLRGSDIACKFVNTCSKSHSSPNVLNLSHLVLHWEANHTPLFKGLGIQG